MSVEQVADKALGMGKGTLLAKIDIQSAYRLVPIWPNDRYLIGMCWEDKVHVDGMLPFGLRLALKIFSASADGLEWCMGKAEVETLFHYLDDFVILGPPDTDMCDRDLRTFKQVCVEMGFH